MSTKSISIHVDGYFGLIRGVNNMLNLFDKYDIKVSFFVSMGKEANIFDSFGYRKKNLRETVNKRYNKFQIAKRLLLPKKLGASHCKILKKIQNKGHEVNPHAWNHLFWSKNFKKTDVGNEISKMYSSYIKCMGKPPKGFTPPAWKWDVRVLEKLRSLKFSYLGIDDSIKKPSLKEGILLIPLSFKYTPEELLAKGLDEEKILRIYEKHLQKDYINLYFHADYEGLKGIDLFEKILELFKGRKTALYEEIYNRYK